MGSSGKTKKWKIVLLLVCLSALAIAFAPPAESYCWFVTDQTVERTLNMGNIGIEIGGRFAEEGAREGSETEAAPEAEGATAIENQENASSLSMAATSDSGTTGSSENENTAAPDPVSGSDSDTVEDTVAPSSTSIMAPAAESESKAEEEVQAGASGDIAPESTAEAASSSQPVASSSLPSYYSPIGTIPKEETPSLPA